MQFMTLFLNRVERGPLGLTFGQRRDWLLWVRAVSANALPTRATLLITAQGRKRYNVCETMVASTIKWPLGYIRSRLRGASIRSARFAAPVALRLHGESWAWRASSGLFSHIGPTWHLIVPILVVARERGLNFGVRFFISTALSDVRKLYFWTFVCWLFSLSRHLRISFFK